MLTNLESENLRQALEPVYAEIKDPKYWDSYPPWREGWCDKWSELALPLARTALSNHDVNLQIQVCQPSKAAMEQYGLPFTFHCMLIDKAASDPLVIDGTYLQFNENSDIDRALPRVLVSRASQTPMHLNVADVHPKFWFQWRPDLYGDNVFMSPEEADAQDLQGTLTKKNLN